METISRKIILETLKATEDYIINLDELLLAAKDIEVQIENSSKLATAYLESTFETLTNKILDIVSCRKSHLLRSIEKMTKDCVHPIKQSQAEITKKRLVGNDLVASAKRVMSTGGFTSQEMCNDFMFKSSQLGMFPALPEIELVPHLTFQASPDSILADLDKSMKDFGTLCKIGPVQLTSLESRPGSLLVAWEDVDIDCNDEKINYCLQMAENSAWCKSRNESLFRDVYIGPEHSHLVKNLTINQEYCFRVRCRTEATAHWSVWGRIKRASTDLDHFKWDTSNKNYIVSDNGRLARLNSASSLLFSKADQIESGHTIKFTLCNSTFIKEDEGVALAIKETGAIVSLKVSGAFFVSFHGEVFIDGKKKTIKLPEVASNHSIIFTCEKMSKKWRIGVEVGSKAVTYDWNVENDKLVFAMLLRSTDIQILVD